MAIVLAIEALLIVSAALYTFMMVTGGRFDTTFGIGLGFFLLVFAAGIAVAARSVLRKGRFGLGYGLTWQLFQALVGASLLRSGLYVPGALALILAIAAFLLLTRIVRSTPLPHRGD